MQTITYNDLPGAVMELNRKVDLILSRTSEPQPETKDQLFTIEQFCDYLPEKPARQTAYGWVNDRKAPFQKHGRRLYFRKSDIDKWLSNGRQMKGL